MMRKTTLAALGAAMMLFAVPVAAQDFPVQGGDYWTVAEITAPVKGSDPTALPARPPTAAPAATPTIVRLAALLLPPGPATQPVHKTEPAIANFNR